MIKSRNKYRERMIASYCRSRI